MKENNQAFCEASGYPSDTRCRNFPDIRFHAFTAVKTPCLSVDSCER